MTYGLDTVTMTKRQDAKLNMLRSSLAVTRLDKVRNENIRGTTQNRVSEMSFEEGQWIYYSSNVEDRATSQRKKRKTKRRLMDVVKKGMLGLRWDKGRRSAVTTYKGSTQKEKKNYSL